MVGEVGTPELGDGSKNATSSHGLERNEVDPSSVRERTKPSNQRTRLLFILFGLSGPLSFLLAYGLISVLVIPSNGSPEIFWLLAVPGYLAGKALGFVIGWMLSIFLILLFHLLPFFHSRPWMTTITGLFTYYLIILSGLILVLRTQEFSW